MPGVGSFSIAIRWSLALASQTLVCRVMHSSQRTGVSGGKSSYDVISVYSWGTRLKDKGSVRPQLTPGQGFLYSAT